MLKYGCVLTYTLRIDIHKNVHIIADLNLGIFFISVFSHLSTVKMYYCIIQNCSRIQ